MYQHKALDLAKENVIDDDKDDSKEMNHADCGQDRNIEGENDFQQDTDYTINENADSMQVEDLRRNPDDKLTTDEILELYKNVVIDDDQLISTDEILKMYETDQEESDSVNDLTKVKKTSRKKQPLKKTK